MNEVYVSKLAGTPLIEYLQQQGRTPCFITGKNAPVYDAVSTHADIYICRLGVWKNVEMFLGNADQLTRHYPGNIIYNAICTGKYFIHNLHYTDKGLLKKAQEWQARQGTTDPLQMIHVSQGYTRCCCLPVDDRSFITSDAGIAKALSHHDTDVLFIEKGHILLPGFDHGFIGGCAGHLITTGSISTDAPAAGNQTILFNGDLSAHPDHGKICDFLTTRGVLPIYFKEYPLMDIGSILCA